MILPLELNGDQISVHLRAESATSDTRVHTKARGAGKRMFKGVAKQFATAAWMDNGEKLKTDMIPQRRHGL